MRFTGGARNFQEVKNSIHGAGCQSDILREVGSDSQNQKASCDEQEAFIHNFTNLFYNGINHIVILPERGITHQHRSAIGEIQFMLLSEIDNYRYVSAIKCPGVGYHIIFKGKFFVNAILQYRLTVAQRDELFVLMQQ